MLKDRLVGGGRLLDVGGSECPQRANELAGAVDEVVILDMQPPIAELGDDVRFMQLPAEDVSPGRCGFFEHILLSNLLEHLDDPGSVLPLMKGLLAPGGSIHILSPNCESLNRRIGVRMGVLASIREIPECEVLLGHKHALSVADVSEMIAGAGLEEVECRGVFLKPVPTPEMIQWPDARIDAFFDIAAEIPPELCHEVYFRATH